jgi:hypothetical protein
MPDPYGRGIDDRRRVVQQDDHVIMVSVVIEPVNPDGVGRARVGKGAQPNDASEEDGQKETRRAPTAPAAIHVTTEGIEESFRARNQARHCLPREGRTVRSVTGQ